MNDIPHILVSIVLILMVAKLGGDMLERMGQPAVVGELLLGIVLGNLGILGFHGLDFLKEERIIEILAEIGVILLLFSVGLESTVSEMKSVGLSALLVATLGVIAPIILGSAVSYSFFPQESILVHAFIGATLCATSVGITARVLQDLGKIKMRESRIILGAAVFDDVLGLIVLAVVSGAIKAAEGSGNFSSLNIIIITAKAVIFFVAAILLGQVLSPMLFRIASRMRGQGILLSSALVLCFFLSTLASAVGLAPIVGAFAAGLIIENVHYRDLADREKHTIDELIHPLVMFFAPIFFVRMGIKVELTALGEAGVILFSIILTLAAIAGKQACSLGVVEKGLNRVLVGVGMIPRGEVGLIFANIGTTLLLHGEPVINHQVFAAVIIMVMITTLLAPVGIKFLLRNNS